MNRTSILITGSNGFIGKNLVSRLEELGSFSIETFTRENSIDDLFQLVKKVDFIVHLAGVNRPNDNSEFNSVNRELTEIICDAIYSAKKNIPLLFTISISGIRLMSPLITALTYALFLFISLAIIVIL